MPELSLILTFVFWMFLRFRMVHWESKTPSKRSFSLTNCTVCSGLHFKECIGSVGRAPNSGRLDTDLHVATMIKMFHGFLGSQNEAQMRL